MPDPLDPRAWNRLGYVYGNPVNFTDPSGHCPICVGIFIGAATGLLIGGGAEYGAQAYHTYLETGDLDDALSLQNKNWTRIWVGATIGGVAGGLTGGVGAAASSGIRGILIRTGTSAVVNATANASYVGAQAYFSEEATLEEAMISSAQYLARNWKRDVLVGAAASFVADVLNVGMNALLESRFSLNPYYLPSPSYRITGGLAGNPTSRAVGGSGLQLYSKIPTWYPSLRALTLVGPEAFSNTGLLSVLYDRVVGGNLQ